jgi:hypothetical protein
VAKESYYFGQVWLWVFAGEEAVGEEGMKKQQVKTLATMDRRTPRLHQANLSL